MLLWRRGKRIILYLESFGLLLNSGSICFWHCPNTFLIVYEAYVLCLRCECMKDEGVGWPINSSQVFAGPANIIAFNNKRNMIAKQHYTQPFARPSLRPWKISEMYAHRSGYIYKCARLESSSSSGLGYGIILACTKIVAGQCIDGKTFQLENSETASWAVGIGIIHLILCTCATWSFSVLCLIMKFTFKNV